MYRVLIPNYPIPLEEERAPRTIPLNLSYYSALLGLSQTESETLQTLAQTSLFTVLRTRASALFEIKCKDSYDYLRCRQSITLHLSQVVSEDLEECSVRFAVSVALMAMDVAETIQALQWESEAKSTKGNGHFGLN